MIRLTENTSPADAYSAITEIGLNASRTLLNAATEMVKVGVSLNPVLTYLQNAKPPSAKCDIPPPCWMPRMLGELNSMACAGGCANLLIRVTNCQMANGLIEVTSKSEGISKIDPPMANVDPMDRVLFNVVAELPAKASTGDKLEFLVWVKGCNAYYLRWTIEVVDCNVGCCQEVEVEDCPDYVHHWYDHFYCRRPCFAASERSTNLNVGS